MGDTLLGKINELHDFSSDFHSSSCTVHTLIIGFLLISVIVSGIARTV